MVRTRATSSRNSRRASSNWRAASSLETIRSRISRLLPTFGPLIVSKSRASAWKVMIEPGGELERGEVPVVGQLLVLLQRGGGRGRRSDRWPPQGDDDLLARLGLAGRDRDRSAGRSGCRNRRRRGRGPGRSPRPARRGRSWARRSRRGGPRRGSCGRRYRTSSRLAKPSVSCRRNQKLKLPLTGIAVLKRVLDESKATAVPAGSSPMCSSADASGLLASASSSSRVPSRARSWVRPGASVWAGTPGVGRGDHADGQRLEARRRDDPHRRRRGSTSSHRRRSP